MGQIKKKNCNKLQFSYPFIFATQCRRPLIFQARNSEMEIKEFDPRFKSAKTRFKLSAGINFETFDTIFSGTNHI